MLNKTVQENETKRAGVSRGVFGIHDHQKTSRCTQLAEKWTT